MEFRVRGGLLAAVAGAAMAACAAPPAVVQRIVVKLVRESDDGTAIAADATRLGGVPVRYAAAVSRRWHALVLQCAGMAECSAAVAALAAAADVYDAVRVDARARIAASPPPG